jgi:hypothetical protein
MSSQLVASRDLPIAPPSDASLTVLLTSPGGVDSPGLDALANVLAGRPGIEVVVAAPATHGGTGAGQTMTGFSAHVVGASAAEAVTAGIAELGLGPDLVVVGVGEGAAVGASLDSSEAVRAARAAFELGVPALAVTAGTEHEPDLAAAGVLLTSLFDLDLDSLLQPGVRALSVPSCGEGTVRGPVTVSATTSGQPGAPDCTAPDPGPLDDDVTAYANGFATLVEV